MVAASGLPIDVFVCRTPELIHAAECCLAVSGSVSLELLYQTRPTAILYWISPLAYWVQKQFRHTRYITLVNMLASEDVFRPGSYDPDSPQDACVLFPEYLTCEDKSQALAGHVIAWLTDCGRGSSSRSGWRTSSNRSDTAGPRAGRPSTFWRSWPKSAPCAPAALSLRTSDGSRQPTGLNRKVTKTRRGTKARFSFSAARCVLCGKKMPSVYSPNQRRRDD